MKTLVNTLLELGFVKEDCLNGWRKFLKDEMEIEILPKDKIVIINYKNHYFEINNNENLFWIIFDYLMEKTKERIK